MALAFTYVRASGERSAVVSRKRLLTVAARQLIRGAGPFTVVRADHYRHPDLRRAAALSRIAAMTLNVEVGERIDATDKAGTVVFDARRERLSIYSNPLRDCIGVRGLREDQGVDYSVTADSQVYAIGPGVVTI